MYLFRKYFDDIQENDLKSLVANNVPEGKTLEYKSELNLSKDSDKKEFLFDVAAMANTEGGIIIYGIVEQKNEDGTRNGKAGSFCNIEISNQDDLKLKIEQLIRSGIEAKISSVGIRFFNIDGNDIMILGIPRFIGMPHMVIRDKTNKFYLRSNTGKYLADITEVNNLFMSNYLTSEKVKLFVQERIEAVRDKKTYGNLDTKFSFFLHIIPLNHFGENIIDFSRRDIYEFLNRKLTLFHNAPGTPRLNLEGYTKYFGFESQVKCFCQLFRNGSLEHYSSQFHAVNESNPDKFFIYGGEIEEQVHYSLIECLDIYRHIDIEPPYSVFIYLFDDGNLLLANSRRNVFFNPNGIMTSTPIHLPPLILMSNQTEDMWSLLKPTFDILWQAGGHFESPNYFHDGARKALQ